MDEVNVQKQMRRSLQTVRECRNVQISAIISSFCRKDNLSVKFSLPHQMASLRKC